MRRLVCLVLCLGVLACAPTTPPAADAAPVASKPAAAPPHDTPEDGPIEFTWTDFHFEMGMAVLLVEGDRVRDLYVDSRRETHEGEPVTVMFHRLATYRLTEDEATALHGAATSPEFLALEHRFVHPDIEDGTTQTFSVVAGGRTQFIYCYQQWPPPVAEVKTHIRDIQTAHAAERKTALEAQQAEIDALIDLADARAKAAGRAQP